MSTYGTGAELRLFSSETMNLPPAKRVMKVALLIPIFSLSS